ncbi:MAG: hypothetical protein JOZ77_01570 [Candidatus Eremiobacteraeota bacterium]|nr:hypothetical protein [Candidatus Eremiobacteraeota bacterium]
MRRFFAQASVLAFVLALVGCSADPSTFAPSTHQNGPSISHVQGSSPIRHVVIIVQENRTFDNLFNGFPGADTVSTGKNSSGKTVVLAEVPMASRYDLGHKHRSWVEDYHRGAMDGFNTEPVKCYGKRSGCPPPGSAAYAFVARADITPYWQMAQSYTLADELFETSEGPSFPAHQYLISGTSTIANGSPYRASENADDEDDIGHQGGCDSLASSSVETIDAQGAEGNPVFPCFERISIMDLLNEHDVSWRYYEPFGGAGEWHAVDAIKQIRDGPSYANVVWPSTRIFNDVRNGRLASVAYVIPTAKESDHPGRTDGTGPSWVASVVNAIGASKYWNSTAIVVLWDDWGGWYDHVPPQKYNSFELGFRVPMIVISPYAKTGYVSHTKYEFGSVLKFVEETFGLPSLDTTDTRANDLSDCFDYGRMPRTFARIKARFSKQYFLRQAIDGESPDDDF